MHRFFKSVSRALPKPRQLQPTFAATKTPFAPRAFTTTTAKMGSIATESSAISADAFLSLIQNRRSYYALSKDISAVGTEKVQSVVTAALQHVPSAFNSQSNRVVVLFGAEHDKLWDFTAETLKAIVPAEGWAATEGKLNGFKAGAGTVLFFEDQTVVEGLQAKFALYADRFPTWANHSTAMLQFAVWTALEAEGLGGNLQHYNPLVDAKIAEEWKVPATWKLSAQLVFGGKVAEAGEKAFGPVEEKLKVYGA